MPRPQIVIENPILNSPFAEPARHFRFDDEGITDEVVEGRRPSSYFMPIPKAKKQGGQLVFDEWTGDRIEENRLINQIRERVGRWRELGWPGVTPTTRALLEYWTNPERERPLFFCQIEALETAIYLTEAAKKPRRRVDRERAAHLRRGRQPRPVPGGAQDGDRAPARRS